MPTAPPIPFRWFQRLTPDEARARIDAGAMCIRYDYVASALFITFRWQSKVHLVRHEASTYFRAIPYSLFTILFGVWGIPWGPIESAKAIWNNLGGGTDVTDEIEEALEA
jgi:hypothetical protein